jgi:flagellar protein FlaI
VYRLENEPINVPRLVLQALDVIAIQAQIRIAGKRARRMQEVVEIVGIDPQTRELLTQRVFIWNAEADTFQYQGRSVILEKIARERGWSDAVVTGVWKQRTDLIERMVAAGVNDSRAIAALVRRYYREPAEAEMWLQTLEERT